MASRTEALRSLAGSVRVRITGATLAVVAVTLVAGGASLVWLLHRSLVNGVVSTASTESAVVSSLLQQGSRLPDLRLRPGTAVQIVDARGRVVSASPELKAAAPVLASRPPPGQRWVRSVPGVLPGDDHDVVVAQTVRSPDGTRTVLVVASTEQAEGSVHDVAVALAGAVPVLVALSGVLAWVLAGRALRPVERIRAEVADLSARDLHRRVPVPPHDDEIGRLARTMNAMLSGLEASRDRQRRFVSDASHELRSPLAALLAEVDVARARPADADWPAVAGTVVEEGSRLSRIIDDLLLLARHDEGQLRTRREPVDLDDLVLEEGERIRSHGRVRADLRGVAAARVQGDRELLRRVVRNLAENAERHATTAVSFEVVPHDGWVDLVVADDGPGIPPQQRRQVFERFARLDSARDRPSGGAGLGLAIVGDVVAAHGGQVEVVDSAVGARFVVRLPVCPPEV